MDICNQTFSPDSIEWICRTIASEPDLSRSALSRRVCEKLGWADRTGRLKEMSCRVALLKLHRAGIIPLPPAAPGPPKRGLLLRGDCLVEPVQEVECRFSELGDVEVIGVGSAQSKLSLIWNHFLQRYHYLGAGPLCGAQMRYLVRSAQHGWLGALAFSAAAWRVEARDRWIGWEEGVRRRNLEKVVCNSRFLILPSIRVPHLASHVLSVSVKRLTQDWSERYGIRPVLVESFVERERFKGTCYRAANWIHVGSTKGRGRQDRFMAYDVAVKDVYLFPLRSDAREVLCDGPAREVVQTRAYEDWAEEEFLGAPMGDKRLGKRLLTIARDLYARPQGNIPHACQSRSKAKGAYRFFEHEQARMETILPSHYEATARRIAKEGVVLAVQDTTDLNYSTHPATSGLGLISSKRGGIIGLLLHDTMAFNTQGTPLGLMDVQCWARNPEDFGKRHLRYELSIEQKESNKWLKSYRAVGELAKCCPDTMLVSVGDREADIYEFFDLGLSDPGGPRLLVRAERDRLLTDGQGHLWEYVSHRPLAGVQMVRVPRRRNRPAREARLEVRFAEVTLKAPKRKPHLPSLRVWAVLACEVDAGADVEPLRWMLLTTVSVNTLEDALERLRWYTLRWGIEVYHKTLKSGCRIEQRRLGSADRIEACLAIDMVVAWRIYHLTKLGRETPDVPCSVFFEEHEWKALVSYVHKDPGPIEKEPTLREAVRMVATLGGFLGRKSDGEPGPKSLWLGLQRLDDIALTWKFLIERFAPHYLSRHPPVSSNPGYG